MTEHHLSRYMRERARTDERRRRARVINQLGLGPERPGFTHPDTTDELEAWLRRQGDDE